MDDPSVEVGFECNQFVELGGNRIQASQNGFNSKERHSVNSGRGQAESTSGLCLRRSEFGNLAQSSKRSIGRPKLAELAPLSDPNIDNRILLKARREYKREYMRRWRSDPDHQRQERLNREQWYQRRKEHIPKLLPHARSRRRSRPTCGICRKRAPVTEIVRLQIRDDAPGGYRQVRIPYCGEC
jgi:hypothetical protein